MIAKKHPRNHLNLKWKRSVCFQESTSRTNCSSNLSFNPRTSTCKNIILNP
uniref:Uncharacterized protein n=1 Tax=Anguilla anguilla TaxID=7936 RepID=A0A0E9TH91_ANGAN